MRRHGGRARDRRVMAERQVVTAMFAARVHRIAQEGDGVVVLDGVEFAAIPVGRYETRLVEVPACQAPTILSASDFPRGEWRP